MASTRLNSDMKRKIRARLIGDQFKKRRDAANKREQALAMAVYRHVFPPNDRRRMSRLPEGWLPTRELVKVELAGKVVGLHSGTRLRVPESKTFGVIAQYDAKSSFSREWTDIEAERRAIADDESRLKAEIDAVLNSVTTDNRLIEKWPEAAKIVREVVSSMTGKGGVPAVQMGKLNKKLGLA